MESASSSDRSSRRSWRRRLLGAVVVLLLASCLRLWVLDAFLVVEDSMWPGLLGGEDRILISRLSSPERWEVWLYGRDDGETGVKRVIGRPGEYLDFRLGDLWVGPTPDRMVRLHRPPSIQEALQIPVYPTPWGEEGIARLAVLPEVPGLVRAEGSRLRLTAADPRLVVSVKTGRDITSENIKDDYQTAGGRFHEGQHAVPDVRIELVVESVSNGDLIIEHDLKGSDGDRGLSVGRSGLRLRRGDSSGTTGLTWDGRYPLALRMETIDGTFRISRLHPETGSVVDVLCDEGRDTERHHQYSRVRLLLERGEAEVRDLRVSRDVYWFWPDKRRHGGPYAVSEGWFLLGDNPPASQDSRDHGPVPEGELVGRAWALVSPWGRRRLLP